MIRSLIIIQKNLSKYKLGKFFIQFSNNSSHRFFSVSYNFLYWIITSMLIKYYTCFISLNNLFPIFNCPIFISDSKLQASFLQGLDKIWFPWRFDFFIPIFFKIRATKLWDTSTSSSILVVNFLFPCQSVVTFATIFCYFFQVNIRSFTFFNIFNIYIIYLRCPC